jgi:hypothetical protein
MNTMKESYYIFHYYRLPFVNSKQDGLGRHYTLIDFAGKLQRREKSGEECEASFAREQLVVVVFLVIIMILTKAFQVPVQPEHPPGHHKDFRYFRFPSYHLENITKQDERREQGIVI